MYLSLLTLLRGGKCVKYPFLMHRDYSNLQVTFYCRIQIVIDWQCRHSTILSLENFKTRFKVSIGEVGYFILKLEEYNKYNTTSEQRKSERMA